jgi:transcriptional regulator
MHPNPRFRVEDSELYRMLIQAVGFGMVFATTPEGPRVAHTPLVATPEGKVRFHLARNNALTPHLPGATVLALVNGPEAYVSPRWYEDRGQVPTWNYVAVEMEGSVRTLQPEELADLLGTIGAQRETRLGGDDPWRPEHVPAERWEALFAGIIGFELEVREWRSTFKLSQNKSAEDRARVADALGEEGSPALAQLMRGLDQEPPA